MSWYYRYETKGIQRWILDSSKLRDLAGGSALIEALTRVAKQTVEELGGKVISAAAGGMLAEMPKKESLEKFASEWPMYVAYRAPGLQVVQAWVETDDAKAALNALHERLLPARRNLPMAPLVEAGPWLERAGRSGLPAVSKPADLKASDARQTEWDEPTVARERARQSRGQEGAIFGGTLCIRELDEEVDQWPEAPIAVLHADGSGVGQRIAKLCGDPKTVQSFSEALETATLEATGQSIAWLRARQGRGKLMIRPVVLGGDDLTVILPARDARGFAVKWLEAFEKETGERASALGEDALHACAGIALVNRGYPFSMAYELAEGACRAAKTDALRGANEPRGSAFRIRRVTTALAADAAPGTSWMQDHFQALDALIVSASRLARGTLRSWLGLLDAGQDRDAERQALWERAREVADTENWRALSQALQAVGADPDTGLFPGNFPSTPLRDVLVLTRLEGKPQGKRGNP